MVHLPHLLTIVAATFAAALPTGELEKRTSGSALISLYAGASCAKGAVGINRGGYYTYGRTYKYDMDPGILAAQYRGKHMGEAVKTIQLCVQLLKDPSGTEYCKSGPPDQKICLHENDGFPDGGKIKRVTVLGLTG